MGHDRVQRLSHPPALGVDGGHERGTEVAKAKGRLRGKQPKLNRNQEQRLGKVGWLGV